MAITNIPEPADEEERQGNNSVEIARIGVAFSAGETVARHGSANAEHIKGYTGIDNEIGIKLHDSLKSVSRQGKGLAQKAGMAAEIRSTNIENSENIIRKVDRRVIRTDDLSRQYGANHPIADRLRVYEDESVSYAQMKFEADPKSLVSKIVSKEGEYAKYLSPEQTCEERAQKNLSHAQKAEEKALKAKAEGRLEDAEKHRNDARDLRSRAENNRLIGASEIKLEVPTEQVELLKRYCLDNASRCRADAATLEAGAAIQESQGNLEQAAVLRQEANDLLAEASRSETLAERVVDSGVSQSEANLAASQPLIVTVKSILNISHRAGLEGAKLGGVIGGVISTLTNAFAVAQNKKQLGEATADVVRDTGKAAALGYGTAFSGAAIKGVMQQSSSDYVRTLSRTNAPALALNICISLGSSIRRYVNDEISESELLEEVGEKGAGMLSSSMMAALGQVVIPVPFVGAAIGGMIGYTLSSFFYQSALDAARGADLSLERLKRIQAIERTARARLAKEQEALDAFFSNELPQLKEETHQLFVAVYNDSDAFAVAINRYANLLGQELEFNSQDEFNRFMCSDQGLRF